MGFNSGFKGLTSEAILILDVSLAILGLRWQLREWTSASFPHSFTKSQEHDGAAVIKTVMLETFARLTSWILGGNSQHVAEAARGCSLADRQRPTVMADVCSPSSLDVAAACHKQYRFICRRTFINTQTKRPPFRVLPMHMKLCLFFFFSHLINPCMLHV